MSQKEYSIFNGIHRQIIEVLPILNKINKVEEIFIVGGTVRDLLIGKDPIDIDLVVKGDVERFANNLAGYINGSIFRLDKKRDAFRIISKRDTSSINYDISPLRGNNIYDDLCLRDFTIDSIALAPDYNKESIIDPFNGQADIRNKCIKSVSGESFKHDPLRMVRAFRLAATLEFNIEKQTYNNIIKQSSNLRNTARERIRDELFKLFTCPNSTKFLRDMNRACLLGEVLSGLSGDETKKGLKALERLEQIFNSISYLFPSIDEPVKNYLSNNLGAGLTNMTAWKWMIMYVANNNGYDQSRVIKAARDLKLSNKVCKLGILSYNNREVPFLYENANDILPIYKFFKSAGDDGIGQLLCMIAISDCKLESNHTLIKKSSYAISWFHKEYRRIKALPLITGEDLRDILHIPPGPLFRQLLDNIEELRVLNKLTSKKDAIAHLKKFLSNL